ncbi:glycosyl transferase, group 1 [Chitinispirillum alkaliphilum]|nr:glycosyl transferase, group 1 [Chitinispirillum alkaliphilum]
MVNNIVTITPNYPNPKFPEQGTFVESLVREWANLGVIVDVVAPIKMPLYIKAFFKKPKKMNVAHSHIVRPHYFSFSNKRMVGIDCSSLSNTHFVKAAIRGSNRVRLPSLYYGKFLLKGGKAAALMGEKNKKPSFADLGESTLLQTCSMKEIEEARKIISKLTGIICVSERLQEEAIELGASPDKILHAPNCVDRKRFKLIDKQYCRKVLGLPLKDFIVSFTGSFIERKGPLRVLKAIETLDPRIKLIFIGKGKQVPRGDRVLHAGSVPNEDVPLWLNASDVFVLPTLAEGHCNAINEALACGIPVVSSDIPDVRWQIPKECGFLVDPKSIPSISNSINTLFSDASKLSSVTTACNAFSKKQQSNVRGKIILDWLNTLL